MVSFLGFLQFVEKLLFFCHFRDSELRFCELLDLVILLIKLDVQLLYLVGLVPDKVLVLRLGYRILVDKLQHLPYVVR